MIDDVFDRVRRATRAPFAFRGARTRAINRQLARAISALEDSRSGLASADLIRRAIAKAEIARR